MSPTGAAGFLIFLLVTSGQADQDSTNELLDNFLLGVNLDLLDSNESLVSIPEFNQTFQVLLLQGGISASSGVLGNLSTLLRTADVDVEVENTTATLTLSLELGTLGLVYSDCNIWLGLTSISNELSVSVGTNALTVQISIELLDDSSCEVGLVSLKFSEIADLDIELLDLDLIPYVADNIRDWILDFLDDDIGQPIEAILGNAFEDQFDNYDFCSLIR